MNIQEKIKLLNVIKNWCFQYYDERSGVSTELCGIQIFKLLPKYRKTFPENCFYTGVVYRKAERGYNCPIHLVACSKEKGTNSRIGSITLNQPRYYQSTCTKGYDLYNIVVFLIQEIDINVLSFNIDILLNRLKDETEVICFMHRKDFRRQK